jgi:cytidylate kinase
MRIAVFGLGLIGGSICRAVRKKFPDAHIAAYNSHTQSLDAAMKDNIINDRITIDSLAKENFDIIAIALPVVLSVDFLSRVLDVCSSSSIVIDAGSVKGGLIRKLESHAQASLFVACHPMAGSEKTGYANSKESLFEGAYTIITPHKSNKTESITRAEDFWKSIGSSVYVISSETHDSSVAVTSHMPHMVSCAVVRAAARYFKGSDPLPFTGKGFRDITRLASGSPHMWSEICSMNRLEIVSTLDSVIEELSSVRKTIASGNDTAVLDYFTETVEMKRGFDMKPLVVAVDGPAGSGKSSVSKQVALRTGLFYIDSGAIYRSVTWYMLEKFGELDKLTDYGQVAASEMNIEQDFLSGGKSQTRVNGEDVSELIRNERIAANIGIISDNRSVREFVTSLLRTWAGEKSVIMDGRDIGTVVFPKADIKIYCDASARVRAERRCREYMEMGKNVDVKEIESQIMLRDEQDRSREYGALKIAEDAILLDTSEMTKEQVIERFLEIIRNKRGA